MAELELDLPLSEAILDLGRLALRESKPKLAEKHFKRLLRISRTNQQRDLEALALNGLGATVSALGELKKAREYYQTALDLAEKWQKKVMNRKVADALGYDGTMFIWNVTNTTGLLRYRNFQYNKLEDWENYPGGVADLVTSGGSEYCFVFGEAY